MVERLRTLGNTTMPELVHGAANEIERLRALADGWCDQHQRDSAELRALCAARDEARAERDELRARIDMAPTMIYGQSAAAGGMPYSLNGKRVALVPLDD